MSVFEPHLERLIELALEEDLGVGDLTTQAVIGESLQGSAVIRAREALVVSGLGAARQVFLRVDPTLSIDTLEQEGCACEAGRAVLRVQGSVASILSAERVALNFLQRLSGVASSARRYAEAVAGSKLKVLDTRKTTPGMRALEKAAVRHGGAHNHRFGLYDGVMLKDNHCLVAGSLKEAVAVARDRIPPLTRIEVEVESLEALQEAIEAGADLVMLDNMDDAAVKEAVALADHRVELEVSGRVTLERLPALAALGVDYVSTGAMIHAARWVDLGLDLELE